MGSPSAAGIPSGVVDLEVSLLDSEVYRLLGYPEGEVPRPSALPMVREVLGEAREQVRARGVARSFPLARASELLLDVVDGDALALGLVTIGSRIEESARQALERGEATVALIFEATGSAAAEEAADALSAMIATGRPGRPERAIDPPCRLSPGYGNWPLAGQRHIFEALPHGELGVTLTDSLLMVPRKSVSFAMWLGASRSPRDGGSPCRRCTMKKCPYRRGRQRPRRTERPEEDSQ